MELNQVIHGDCLEILKTLSDNSVDAVVTDPPYGLSFMGKKWDYDVPSQEIWQEALRVLKPGGYLLAFAGTRTQHRMAVRIEDAGFEIRDMIAWIYGSGFPKSLNIGKVVDKLQGNEREVIGKGKPMSSLGTMHDDNWKSDSEYNETKGTSEWEGWGTALKPALEPITVARKPIEGTVAENCLKWGVGGINIDGCRVEGEKPSVPQPKGGTGDIYGFKNGQGRSGQMSDNSQGRFPANLIHDGSDEVVEMFPYSKTTAGVKNLPTSNIYGGNALLTSKTLGTGEVTGYSDDGSAARFFYCAKASKRERSEGNNHPTVKPIALMEYLVKLVSREGAVVLDPFAGSGSTLVACKNLNRQYIGIEREHDYIKIIEKRLIKEKLF